LLSKWPNCYLNIIWYADSYRANSFKNNITWILCGKNASFYRGISCFQSFTCNVLLQVFRTPRFFEILTSNSICRLRTQIKTFCKSNFWYFAWFSGMRVNISQKFGKIRKIWENYEKLHEKRKFWYNMTNISQFFTPKIRKIWKLSCLMVLESNLAVLGEMDKQSKVAMTKI